MPSVRSACTLSRGLLVSLTLVICAIWAPAALGSQPPHPVFPAATAQLLLPPDGTTVGLPEQLAINAANHTLLVADRGAGPVPGHVSVYSYGVDSGTGIASMTAQPSVGVGDVTAPYGLAVDQITRALYVSDATANRILRYTFTTGSPATFTRDPSFVSPTLGAGVGQIGSFGEPPNFAPPTSGATLAVDPATHDLLVSDPTNHLVSRYTASGTFVRSFDGSTDGGRAFLGPVAVTVGADGVVYVADGSNPNPYGSPGRLERFDATGHPLGDVPGVGTTPAALGVGASLGTLYVGGTHFVDNPVPDWRLEMYGLIGVDPTQALPPGSVDANPERPDGIAVDDSLGGNLYVDTELFGGSSGIYVLTPDPVLAPGVTIGSPSSVTATTAHVSATLDAGDTVATASTSAHFQYYTTDPSNPTILPDLTLTGAGAQTVGADLTGLRPNTTYHVQLIASRNDDTLFDPNGLPYARTTSRLLTVTAAGAPPVVVEPPATDVGSTTATLPGRIDPYGLQASYHFEYGATDAYGSRSPASVEGSLGAPDASTPVDAALTGLSPSTTYHYRLVATNSVGTTYGPDRELTTDPVATLDAARAYEQITPVDKNGALMQVNSGVTVRGDASLQDGNQMSFSTRGALPDAPSAVGTSAQYVATRGATGWSTQFAEVPFTTLQTYIDFGTSVLSGRIVTQHPVDFDHSLVFSDLALVPGATAGMANLYREDNHTQALTFLGSLPGTALNDLAADIGIDGSATPDSSRLFIHTSNAIYEANHGQMTLRSVTPGGSPVTVFGKPFPSGSGTTPDGAVVYAGPEGAYVNRNGQVTPLSVSERIGDSATPQSADQATVTPDGRSVFFLETGGGGPLTADGNTQPGAPIYRYTFDAPAGHHLTYVGGLASIVPNATVSLTSDGQTAVFPTDNGLMAWRNGALQTLSPTYGQPYQATPTPTFSLSPSGRYFTLATAQALTDDANVNTTACLNIFGDAGYDGHCVEVYLFDLDGHTVACASCATDGRPPGGEAEIGQPNVPAVTDDGEVFFDTPTKLVRADENSAQDVYGYQAGHVRLLSSGATGTHAIFAGASASGRDVFLMSDDRLVSQDDDHSIDLYDARIGGGFAAQNPGPAPAPCAAAECREPGGGLGATTGAGTPSESVVSKPMTSRPTPRRARVTASKVVVGSTSVRLAIHASSRGDLRVSGHYLTTLKRTIAAPGTYTFRVALSRAAQRLHHAHHSLRVGVRVSLTPPFGAPAAATLTRTLRG